MSTGIFLRRTVTRVGPVLFGAILVGLGFHLGGTPVPPKAPVSAATPAAARSSPARLLAEAAVRELEAAEDLWIDDQGTVRPRPADGRVPEGGRPLVGNDPLLFGPCLEQMPALTEHYARRARGEVEWHDLPEEDRAALQQVAADFMGQGLPDPFWPLLDVGPGEAVRPEDEDARRHLEEVKFEAERRERVLPTQGPWLQTTWARVARARRLGEALEEELESLSSPLVRTLGVQQAVMVTSDPHGVFAGHFQQPLLRPELERVLRDERRAYQGAMWAVGRTIRFGTPEEGEEAAHLLWVIAGDYRFLFFSHLAQVEPEALLGIQGTTPAGARAVFRISDTQRRARVATPERIRNHGPDRLAELADRMVEGPLDSGVEVTRAREGLGYFADLQRERGGDDFDRRRDRLLVRLDGPHAEWYRVELGGVR